MGSLVSARWCMILTLQYYAYNGCEYQYASNLAFESHQCNYIQDPDLIPDHYFLTIRVGH